jgi:hypothetical protein
VVQTYAKSVMCYGCEVWTINKRIQSQLEAAEMWFLRRMMKVPWAAKTSNEIILMRANETRALIKETELENDPVVQSKDIKEVP